MVTANSVSGRNKVLVVLWVLVYPEQTPRRPGNDFGYRELHEASAYRHSALRLWGLTVVDHVAAQIGPHAGQVPRVSADPLLRTKVRVLAAMHRPRPPPRAESPGSLAALHTALHCGATRRPRRVVSLGHHGPITAQARDQRIAAELTMV